MVSRRSFLQAMAAAMTVPIIDLRPAVHRENLLLKFCDPEYQRFNLSQPFGVGSLTYATDSRAMIRTELVNRSEVGEMRTPPVQKVWHDYWHPYSQWRPLDETILTPTITREEQLCPKCGDARVSVGEGYPNYSDPAVVAMLKTYRYDPDENTIRDRSCDVCHGLDYTDPAVSDIFGVQHSTFMLHRIAALPNAMVTRSESVQHAVLFKADGFQGISLGWSDL